MSSESNRRIAKNTLMLYFRMLITMAVSLYTSRIVLNTLGVIDYGLFNVVGGFITMFAFLNNSMASATQRFFSFELGRKDFEQLGRVFSMSVNIHFLIAFIILILGETIGLWFVNTHLTIPPERMEAANWVYQFSIFAFMVTVISVPYNALIIAHERMNVYAWVSILEVSLKLLIVFMLQWFGFDKLKLYAILIFSVTLVIRVIYGIYCSRNFSESLHRFFWDRTLFKTLFNYAGWNLWGNAAAALYDQGINVLLNIFFGPVVNAARGIAYSVRSAVNAFVTNLQMAINPQIVKSYAVGNLGYMHTLIFQGAKFSFFLLFTLTLPILLETDIILSIWLKNVPDYSIVFTRLVLLNVLIDTISGPLKTAAQASGKIKFYQGVVGGLLLLILPLSYLFIKLGYPPQVTLFISISISIIALFARLIIISPLVDMSISGYFKKVILRIIPVIITATTMSMVIQECLREHHFRFMIVTINSVTFALLSIYYFGINNPERSVVKAAIVKIIGKLK